MVEALDPTREDLITIFIGDLHNCRERKRILEEEGIPSVLVGDLEGTIPDAGIPILSLRVEEEDIEDVRDIFEELWQETLDLEGLQEDNSVIDLNQDVITCPGCQTELTEVTEEGLCPECGLFLGLPEEEDDGEDEEA